MGLYAAYLAVVLHVALGALQAARNPLLAVVMMLCVLLVGTLHVAAGYRRLTAPVLANASPWIVAGPVAALAEGHGLVVPVPGGEPVAVFRHEGHLSAVSNLCAHQNGPLGEGRVIDGCITCPWHGFQYRLADGCAPPPFTEKLATFALKIEDGMILVDPRPNPPGTFVEPVAIP
jgi:nitrite reductase/ring-hydroxylating ferredoxin subunit